MKDYIIQRHPNGHVAVSVVPSTEDDTPNPPVYMLDHLVKHSPDGFEYGYGGSGPSDLARSIVGDYMVTDDPDPRIYQYVKKICIAPLDRDADFHVITSDRLDAIIKAHQR